MNELGACSVRGRHLRSRNRWCVEAGASRAACHRARCVSVSVPLRAAAPAIISSPLARARRSRRVRICAWQKHVSSYIAHEQRTPNDVSLKLRSQSPLGDVTGHGRERVGSADAEFEGGVAWSRCSVSALYDPAARRGMEGYVRRAPDCYFSPADTLPASRTVLRPPRAMTVRVRVPGVHSDLVTRAARSANIHPDRPGVFQREVYRVISDEPPVDGNHTTEKRDAARLASFEVKQAAENQRQREKSKRNKAKAAEAATAKLRWSGASSTNRNEPKITTMIQAWHLSLQLLALFQQPLHTVDVQADHPKLLEEMIRMEVLKTIGNVMDVAPGWFSTSTNARVDDGQCE